MKYKVTRRAQFTRPDDKQDAIFEVEADQYVRENQTFTFFRGDQPVGTYEDVRQVEEIDLNSD